MLLIILLLAGVQSLYAQRSGQKVSFYIGYEIGLPTGNLKDTTRFVGGPLLKLSILAGPGYVTINSGLLLFFPDKKRLEDLKASIQIPVKAGYKYLFDEHFFVAAETGVSIFKRYSIKDNSDNLVSETSTGFTIGPVAGVQFGKFEIALHYEHISLSKGNAGYVGFRLGSNF